jgi:hypothetical protein
VSLFIWLEDKMGKQGKLRVTKVEFAADGGEGLAKLAAAVQLLLSANGGGNNNVDVAAHDHVVHRHERGEKKEAAPG